MEIYYVMVIMTVVTYQMNGMITVEKKVQRILSFICHEGEFFLFHIKLLKLSRNVYGRMTDARRIHKL